MIRRTRATLWAAVSVGAATLAVVVVVGWAATRPTVDEGPDLATLRAGDDAVPPADPDPEGTGEETGAADAEPTADETDPADSPESPDRPEVRDASLEALTEQGAPAPTRIVVGSLDIDAVIDPVGVESDGSMTIPRSPSRIGWYQFGRSPASDEGNTVLAGHVNTIAEGRGALFPLREAEIGSVIDVYDADGTVHSYEVASREQILKDELPTDEIFARDGRPLLVVVTCGGDFIPGTRRYEDNVIVTAVPVGEGGSADPAEGA